MHNYFFNSLCESMFALFRHANEVTGGLTLLPKDCHHFYNSYDVPGFMDDADSHS